MIDGNGGSLVVRWWWRRCLRTGWVGVPIVCGAGSIEGLWKSPMAMDMVLGKRFQMVVVSRSYGSTSEEVVLFR